jgi:hypothetical protein
VHVINLGVADATLALYAGGISSGAKPIPGGVVLDLVGRLVEPAITITGAELPRLARAVAMATVRIVWPDGGVAPLTREQWQALTDDLASLAVERGHLDVLVGCHGGHGRTGTALAIMLSLWGAIPADECPVAWVRNNYCVEVVETKSQVTYIADITGRTVTSEPRPMFTPIAAPAFDLPRINRPMLDGLLDTPPPRRDYLSHSNEDRLRRARENGWRVTCNKCGSQADGFHWSECPTTGGK